MSDVTVRSLIYVIACLVATGCVGSQCGNEVLSEASSPDEKYVATVFSRNCGATTPFVRVVSIRPVESEFDGNDEHQYVFTMEGDHEVTLQWSSASRLVIRRPPVASEIFKELTRWKEVQVATEP